jgi:hypothetical protein
MDIYYKKELIGAESISELDFELQDRFGFDYEIHDDFVDISEVVTNTYGATPIDIDRIIKLLEAAKKNGANFVEVVDHCDHHGYEFSFLKIRAATEDEIINYLSQEKNKTKSALELEEKQLKDRLAEIEKEKKKDTREVNLIMPQEHGNGGWCGAVVLAKGLVCDFLSIDPVFQFLNGYYEPMFGSELVLCITEDPNDPLYTWNHLDNVWEKCK